MRNVTKEFQLDERTRIKPVDSVTLDIGPGDFVVIVGRSGTGKTTLLNLAAGLVRPSSGQVTIDGQDLAGMTDQQLSALRTRRLGFVFQFPSLLASFTVLENITMPTHFGQSRSARAARDRALESLKILGLLDKKDVYPRQLSAGEQKRVVVLRSLINEPQVILADEPTSDLDFRTEKEVMALFREMNGRGVAFLMVTHSLGLLPFATRAFEMESGHLKKVSAPRSA